MPGKNALKNSMQKKLLWTILPSVCLLAWKYRNSNTVPMAKFRLMKGAIAFTEYLPVSAAFPVSVGHAQFPVCTYF